MYLTKQTRFRETGYFFQSLQKLFVLALVIGFFLKQEKKKKFLLCVLPRRRLMASLFSCENSGDYKTKSLRKNQAARVFEQPDSEKEKNFDTQHGMQVS